MTKSKITFISLAVIIIAGLGFAYWYWTGTPTYSLQQVQKALETNDVVKFEKHVDIKSISSRLIDDLMNFTLKEPQPQSELEGFGISLAAGLVHLMKPHLIDSIYSQTIRQVEKGNFGNFNSQEGTEDSQEINVDIDDISEQLGVDKESFSGVSYIRKDGKVALAGLAFQSKDFGESMILELRLRNMGRYWQVVEISNITELLQEIEIIEAASLERSEGTEQPDIFDVEVSDISLKNIRQYFVANERVGDLFVIEGLAVNNHNSEPAIITIKVELYDQSGQTITGKDFICGKVASLIDLQVSSKDYLQNIFDFDHEAVSKDYIVAPRESVPFMTIFYNPPENAHDFGLEVVEVFSP